MVPRLHVSVRLCDIVVDDQLCEVTEPGWLGDCDAALVAFPGGRVRIEPVGESVAVQGECLEIEAPVRMSYGSVEVVLEVVPPEALPRDWSWVPDPAILAATVALLLLGAFVDTMKLASDEAEALAAKTPVAFEEEGVASAGRVAVSEESYPAAEDTGQDEDVWPPVVTFRPE